MSQSLMFPLLSLVLVLATLLAMGAYVHFRMLTLMEGLERTRSLVDAFADASVAVGERLDLVAQHSQLFSGTTEPNPLAGRSPAADGARRALLLRQAREDYLEGVPIDEVAVSAGLSAAEVGLLKHLPLGTGATR